MKKHAFFVIFFMNNYFVYCQNNDSLLKEIKKSYEEFVIYFKWGVFKTSDSTYNVTEIIDQNGNFYFKMGFIDSTYTGDSYVSFGKKKAKTSSQYIHIFKYVSGIDTINSHIPVVIKYNETPIEEVFNGVTTVYMDIIDDIKYSYIFKKLNKTKINSSNNSILRVLNPVGEHQTTVHYPDDILIPNMIPGVFYAVENEKNYNLYEIGFFENSAMIYNIAGRSNDSSGMQIIKSDSAYLKNKDLEKIRKELGKINTVSNVKCRVPGNPWLLEYWNNNIYYQFIITNDCLRERKNLRSSASLYYLIGQMNIKYFHYRK